MEKPTGEKFFIPGTPSDYRAYENWKSGLRKFLPEAFAAVPPSRPIQTLVVEPTAPKVVNSDLVDVIAEVREYDVEAIQASTIQDPIHYLEALSTTEIEAFLAQRKARAEEERLQHRKAMLIELEMLNSEIEQFEAELKKLNTRSIELKNMLGYSLPVKTSLASLPKTLFDRVLDDPVLTSKGEINVKATAVRHEVDYQSLMKEVKKRNLPRASRGSFR